MSKSARVSILGDKDNVSDVKTDDTEVVVEGDNRV